MSVDWTKPIEAVHEDGRVAAVEPTTMISQSRMRYAGRVDGDKWGFADDGYPLSGACPWRIRNVAESAKPIRTAAEMLERMEALVRRMAGAGDVLDMTEEARAIVADMTPPVDPDVAGALKVLAENGYSNPTPDGLGYDLAIKAIKWARTNS